MSANVLPLQSFELLVLVGCIVGWYLAYLYGRNTKKFRWREYLALTIVPVAGSLAFSFYFGVQIIYLFLISAGTGFILEYLLGLMYYKTLNAHLWSYGKFATKGRYTSFLTLPMWGVAGIVFFLLSKYTGL